METVQSRFTRDSTVSINLVYTCQSVQEIDDEVNEDSKTTNDDYNDDEESDIIIVEWEEAGKVKKKYTYQEVVRAFDMIQSFMEDEKLPLERRLALDRLRYNVQVHQMQKPKASPTINTFFQPIHKL